jgi:polar amino acid transport system permease protein
MDSLYFIRDSIIPPLLEGTIVTLKLSLLSIFFGYILGVFVSMGRVFGNQLVRLICDSYAFFFRGVPLLVQLLIIFYGLPSVGIFFSPYISAIIGFSICSAAYHSEYIRGSILSIKSGQMMAAEALGMSRFTAIFGIIMPQALRKSLPSCSNEIISLIKYSSLAFMVTAIDLTGAAKIVGARYFRYTEIFLTVGVIYLVLTFVVDRVLRMVEQKLKIPGIG